VSLGGEELSPARSGPSRCGWQTGLEQDGAHGAGGEAVAEAEEFAGDALVAPVRISRASCSTASRRLAEMAGRPCLRCG
jgi:hypothetical protein